MGRVHGLSRIGWKSANRVLVKSAMCNRQSLLTRL